MPKRAKELSALEVKRLAEPGYHFVGGVPGLALQVLPSGGRTWVLRTMVGTKRRDMGLGGSEISLAEARAKAKEARENTKKGIDPIAQAQAARSALRASAASAMTFKTAAEKYIEVHRAGWRNPKHIKQWESTLKTYAYPHIGALNVRDIGVAHVLAVLEQQAPVDRRATSATFATFKTGKLWEVRTETASRVRGRIESVLDWCKGRGYRSGDNPASWKGCLDAQLPEPTKVARVVNHAAVSLDEMAGFMAELHQREGIAARALEFAILCASRSGEVRGANWSEINLDTGVWVVPGERMKAGKEHRVPLSADAVELLKALPRFEGVDLVFPAPRGGMLSDMTLSAVMRRMGREEVPHGFRSTFRDWVSERTNYPGEMPEVALAHAIGSKVEASYRRGDQLEKRRTMMDSWARFCSTPTSKGNVVGIGKRKGVA
jgi:integrase